MKPSRIVAILLAGVVGACAAPADTAAWEQRLRGRAVVLLGEVHDNAQNHRLRLQVLQRAIDAGWRPAIVMEQFDRERQPDIERARNERPGDAVHLIDAATSAARPAGWDWALYRPVVELALRHDLPLIAGNLSNADATRIVRGGLSSVFDTATLATLGLAQPADGDWQAAQEKAIDAGHCHALPSTLWPKMASAQFARDAVMADALRRHDVTGAVLLAGNGHVRRDLGVPRWLSGRRGPLLAVGFLEAGDAATPPAAFDAGVRVGTSHRPDPCARFEGVGRK